MLNIFLHATCKIAFDLKSMGVLIKASCQPPDRPDNGQRKEGRADFSQLPGGNARRDFECANPILRFFIPVEVQVVSPARLRLRPAGRAD